MHELGIMFNVVKSVEKIATENGATKIDTLVLQIGELSPVVPEYIVACFPAASDGTMLQDTKLKIETIPGNGKCKDCGKVFNFIKSKTACPYCGGSEWELLSGKEFNIKEIMVS